MSARSDLISATDPSATATAPLWAQRGMSYRSNNELAIRVAVEAWGRVKWPGSRVVHELVMGRGVTRADMAFVAPDRLVSIEIKSEHDDVTRILNQVGMFRLASHELWVVVADRHHRNADLLQYLLPSIGTAVAQRGESADERRVAERAAPITPFEPHRDVSLGLLWVDELRAEADRHRVGYGKRAPHADLVKRLSEALAPAEIDAAVCRQLRGRDAFWRADPPIAPDDTP